MDADLYLPGLPGLLGLLGGVFGTRAWMHELAGKRSGADGGDRFRVAPGA